MAGRGVEQRRNHKLRALLANASEGLIAVDETGTVRLMNEAAESMLGRARGEAVGKPVAELRDRCSSLADEVERALKPRARQRHKPLTVSVADRVYAIAVSPYRSHGERGVSVTLRDETELAREQERAQAVLASTGDGLVVFAPDNRVTYINPSASDMLGVDAGKAIGSYRTMSELLGLQPPDAKDATPCWELLSCEHDDCPQYGAADLRCWLASGTVCDGDHAVFAEKQQRCQGCDVYRRNSRLLEESGMSAMREVTLTKPAHRILKLKTNPVIDSMGAYIGCVTSLHDITAEREIAQMKNEFVSTVSHELRTPLTSIKGYVDLILDGEAGEVDEIQREFLTIVKQNSDRLVSLINELLDISRIESGRIHLKVEPLDLRELISGAVGTFRTAIEQAGIDLVVKVPDKLPLAAGDRDRVGQVLVNLISNAIKYSPGGGTVTVSARTRPGQVLVSVADTGIGIAKEDQDKLFSKFYRVDSSLTREIGGTGLGLSICKTIIDLLGGQIWVTSTLGKGSTFSFSLPQAPRALVRIPHVEVPAIGKGAKVLVVDPEPEVANLIEIYLRKHGHDVVKAHNAQEAMRQALEAAPDVITLDVMLEDADGFDLLQQMKEDSRVAQIPVVVLSIVCDERRSWRFGAANYLEKPINQERLVGIINDLVGSVDRPYVLVVDDDRQIVDRLTESLKSRGFVVAPAYDGREAMAVVDTRKPDLILLDLRMPKMDGYQVIKALKRDSATADIPIVVMTAHHIDHEKTAIMDMTSALLAKPFDVEALAERVQELVEKEREPA